AIISYTVILAGLVLGAAIGAYLARRTEMTDMPQLVALFNGFGGGASALVALAEVTRAADETRVLITIAISILIGMLTLTGSLVAFAKLQGLMSGGQIHYPGQRLVDPFLALGAVAASVLLVAAGGDMSWAWAVAALAAILGISRELSIGGADMPVVNSFLNLASGMAASSAGFVIGSNALIIYGALVGAAGLILTMIMVKAMNRTLGEVLFGAFGGEGAGPTGTDS